MFDNSANIRMNIGHIVSLTKSPTLYVLHIHRIMTET